MHFEVNEVIFSARQGTSGRLLIMAEDIPFIRHAIEEDFMSGRFGRLGLNRNRGTKWLGLPLTRQKRLDAYLLATFLEGERAVPFRGILINANQLKTVGWDLRCFIDAWGRYISSNPVDLETYWPGLVLLNVVEVLVNHNNHGTDMAAINAIHLGRCIRMPDEHTTMDCALTLLSHSRNSEALSRWTWSSAPFQLPSDIDGAKLHVATSPEGKKEGEIRDIKPITLSPDHTNLRLKSHTPKVSVAKKIGFGLSVVLIGVMGSLFWGSDKEEIHDAQWWSRQLGQAAFNDMSLEKNICVVSEGLDALYVSGKGSVPNIIRRLIGLRIIALHKQIKQRIEADYIQLDRPVTSEWMKILKKSDNIDFEHKSRAKLLLRGLFEIARQGVADTISSQTIPSPRNVEKLYQLVKFTGKYPEEMGELEKVARSQAAWFDLQLDLAVLNSNPKNYDNYKRIYDRVNRYKAPAIYEIQLNMILRKLSEEWGAYQLRQVKTLYNQMITAEKSIHGHKENLLKKIERLKEIPHYNEPGRIRTIRLSFLKLIEGRKIVLPQVQVQFSPTLQAKIKDLQNLVKRKLGMTQNENVFLEHVFRDQRFIVRIKNNEIRDMSFIVALMHPSILKLKIDKKDISEVALPNEQIEQWLGTPGKVAALLFKDKSNHRLLSLTYKYPTHESLGLKYWE